MFQAIDKVSSQGLEAMLKEIERVAMQEHDYDDVWHAKFELKRIELGLPKNYYELKKTGKNKAKLEQLEKARKQFREEAAELYKADGNLSEAASNFAQADKLKEAMELYLQDGSKDSIVMAIYYAIDRKVNPKLGFDLMIKKEDIRGAFWKLDRDVKFNRKETQQWGEYLTKAVYKELVKRIKKEIEREEGKTPKGETIPHLIKDRKIEDLFIRDHDLTHIYDDDLGSPLRYAYYSEDPEVLQMGIDMCVFKNRTLSNEEKKEHFKDTEMYLRGKLTGAQEYINYFIAKATEEKAKKEDYNLIVERYALQAIDLLEHHKKFNAALEVAERFLSPKDVTRCDLLMKVDKTQGMRMLLDHYKKTNNVLNYAFALAEQQGKTRT